MTEMIEQPRMEVPQPGASDRARWVALMRESIAELGPRFGTARMAAEYVERLYLPAHDGALRAPRPPR